MVKRVYADASSGRILPGEIDIIFRPRTKARGLRGVVFLHGQLQQPTAFNDRAVTPGQTGIVKAICETGLYGLAAYFGGPLWGNPSADLSIESALNVFDDFGCAVDKLLLVGMSMGALEVQSFMTAYPDLAAAAVCGIPAIDMRQIREVDPAGVNARTWINRAYGFPDGATEATNPLPADANPFDDQNAAIIATSGPIKYYYSTADAVVDPAKVPLMATKVGGTATVVDTVSGHTDTTMAVMPKAEIADFIRSHAG